MSNGAAVHGSAARTFHSLRELTDASRAVVQVRATPQHTVEVIGGVPFTVTTVEVTKIEHGSVNGQTTLHVRQLGGEQQGVAVASNAVLLRPGTDYVLFVEPFSFGDGRDTGQWVIVGPDAGQYELQGDRLVRSSGAPVSTDAEDTVPATMSLAQLRAALAT